MGQPALQPLEADAVRARLEDAIIAALSPLLTTNGGYLQGIRPYNGEVHGEPDDVKIDLLGQAPAVLVGTGVGRDTQEISNRYYTQELIEIEVFLISTDLRLREARTRNVGGIYQMLRDVRSRIQGLALDIPGVSTVKILSTKPIVRVKGFTIWLVEAAVVAMFKTPSRDDADLVLTAIRGEINGLTQNNPITSGNDGTATAEGSGAMTFAVTVDTFEAGMEGYRVQVLSGANLGSHEILSVVDARTVTWTDLGGATDTSVAWQLLLPPGAIIQTEVS